jgi:excinuclease ABC subunit C
MANKNAKEALLKHKLKRNNDLTARSLALNELKDLLEMEIVPYKMEAYDISHTANENKVASIVVFVDGMPAKDQYRWMNITSPLSTDDTWALKEALGRRFEKHNEWPLPDLMVIDGGKPQVNVAQETYDKAKLHIEGIRQDIKICSLAKRLEEVWFANNDFPLILPRHSESLYLLQNVRDESHRFAFLNHSRKRTNSQQGSKLTQIQGVGKKTSAALLKKYKSITQISKQTPEELASVQGVSVKLAEKIIAELKII